MRRNHLSRCLVLLASGIFVGNVIAADDSVEKPNRERKPSAERPVGGPGAGQAAMLKRLPIIVALDKDQDGEISASEIDNAVAALRSLDKNGDGKLTLEELRPQAGGPRGEGGPRPEGAGPVGANPEMMARMFTNRDTNGDGKLSGDEIPEPMRDRLDRIDTNGDGAIDQDELKKGAARAARMLGGEGRPERTPEGTGVKPKRPQAE
jgi:Ca2+-binding EF-hand superfamily protein